MSQEFYETVRNEVNSSLDFAEENWNKVAHHFAEKSLILNDSVEKIPSNIPGFPFVENGKPDVDDFIALFLDIRNSTKHLTEAISMKKAKASQLERLLYETTAIFTSGSLIIDKYNGKITEFLGDGFLALFKDDKKNCVYNAHNAAKKCIEIKENIINKILYDRYQLPRLEIGIGMAYSQAIVTLVGHKDNKYPKAIGECIYRASKLSTGNDEILIDDRLNKRWPTSKGGKLSFIQTNNSNFDFKSYKIEKKNS